MDDPPLKVFNRKPTAEVMQSLLGDNNFADVTLVAGNGKCIKAHKAILAASSSVFNNILLLNPHPMHIIYFNNISSEVVEFLKIFIYNGECQLPATILDIFLDFGKQIGLVGLCEESLNTREKISTNEVINIDNSKLNQNMGSEEVFQTQSNNTNVSINDYLQSIVNMEDITGSDYGKSDISETSLEVYEEHTVNTTTLVTFKDVADVYEKDLRKRGSKYDHENIELLF